MSTKNITCRFGQGAISGVIAIRHQKIATLGQRIPEVGVTNRSGENSDFFHAFFSASDFLLRADEQLFGFVRGGETLWANHSETYQFVTLHEGKSKDIRDQKCRAQFVRKRANRRSNYSDIKNTSRATLSCRHIT